MQSQQNMPFLYYNRASKIYVSVENGFPHVRYLMREKKEKYIIQLNVSNSERCRTKLMIMGKRGGKPF